MIRTEGFTLDAMLPLARMGTAARVLLAVLGLLACAEPEPGPGAPAASAEPERPKAETIFVNLGGESFELELALDPETRFRGLSGRGTIPSHRGMLFVLPRPRPFAMVMRDCSEPIDVAFLDAAGRVVEVHAMRPEPPREPGETSRAYELRLRRYPSGAPVSFAIEVAGGRLSELGIAEGSQVPLDAGALRQRAK